MRTRLDEQRYVNPQYTAYASYSLEGRRGDLARLVRRAAAAHLAIMRIIKGRAA